MTNCWRNAYSPFSQLRTRTSVFLLLTGSNVFHFRWICRTSRTGTPNCTTCPCLTMSSQRPAATIRSFCWPLLGNRRPSSGDYPNNSQLLLAIIGKWATSSGDYQKLLLVIIGEQAAL